MSEIKSVLWFRHGLRLHDNPSLISAIKNSDKRSVTFYPIFIFDGESAGTKNVGYNRMKFLLESLADLDESLKKVGGNGLILFKGDPTEIFRKLITKLGINKICYEQDCEPIWKNRDEKIEKLCEELKVKRVEKISHTLWDPKLIIKTNGGYAPLTYQMMLHTIQVLGLPPRPVNESIECINFIHVKFGKIPLDLASDLDVLDHCPTPEYFSIFPENCNSKRNLIWKGGESRALEQLQTRLNVERKAFENGGYLPNQANVDLLASPTSMSAALKFGCLSVRKFYYEIQDLFKEVQMKIPYHFPSGHHITGQLIWREYFYTMSVNNPNYGQMLNNPICLDIPWKAEDPNAVDLWKKGLTGIPIIDAAMRQLLSEGWLHHTMRNLVATFLTRTGLWLSWEIGFQHFLKHLLDADWSICAGNWMWVSSSAFEKLLDSSRCAIIPFSMRLDPKGEYIKRYVPELYNFPVEFIHQPWKAPRQIQEKVKCIIGQNYPEPMIDLTQTAQTNCAKMKNIRDSIINAHPHIRPSNDEEIRLFFWITDEKFPVKCQ